MQCCNCHWLEEEEEVVVVMVMAAVAVAADWAGLLVTDIQVNG